MVFNLNFLPTLVPFSAYPVLLCIVDCFFQIAQWYAINAVLENERFVFTVVDRLRTAGFLIHHCLRVKLLHKTCLNLLEYTHTNKNKENIRQSILKGSQNCYIGN